MNLKTHIEFYYKQIYFVHTSNAKAYMDHIRVRLACILLNKIVYVTQKKIKYTLCIHYICDATVFQKQTLFVSMLNILNVG